MDYELQELSKEEAEALTKDLQEVLAKYNAEMGVSSTINLMKRAPKPVPTPAEFLSDDQPDTQTESGG